MEMILCHENLTVKLASNVWLNYVQVECASSPVNTRVIEAINCSFD
jgi:hypothetical protein